MSKISMRELLPQFPKVMNTIVHVGASYGQEVETYIQHGARQILLIEPLPNVAAALRQKFADYSSVIVEEVACLDYNGWAKFYVADNDGMSSSIFDTINTSMHSVSYVDIVQEVRVIPLDDIILKHGLTKIELLVIDAQGSEDKVLRGAPKTLQMTERIFCEASLSPLYSGACIMSDIEPFFHEAGFYRQIHYLNDRGTGDILVWKE